MVTDLQVVMDKYILKGVSSGRETQSKQNMRVTDQRSLSLKHGVLPNTDDSKKHWKLSFLLWGEKCLPVCQKEKDVVRKEEGGGGGGRVVFHHLIPSV